MKKGLLIVDLQYDFMPGGALGVERGDEIIRAINDLIGKFDVTAASQDWHPEGHVSFAKTHGKKVGETVEVHGRAQELWPIHCVQNTHGAALVKELNQKEIDHFVYKGANSNTDSYSAFLDNDGETETGLDDYLRERGVKKLYIVGLATDFCVKFSALDALELGYEVVVIADACRAVYDEDKALEEMKQKGAKVAALSDL
ncbi:MAG: bifunctional nicotinamidase/pyrazinamidase [Chlamydiia bacterium]|nr:bifunctional nicotinamidase/pyrazinamidase [Chlamydiia bacterium]